jgi:hypothetical protein
VSTNKSNQNESANYFSPCSTSPPAGTLRQLGVRGLLLVCVDPKCRHEATMSMDDYPDAIELPSRCGGKRITVRPNWKEMPIMPPKLLD